MMMAAAQQKQSENNTGRHALDEIHSKTWLLVAALIVGSGVFCLTIKRAKVSGPLHSEIRNQKDLFADNLPTTFNITNRIVDGFMFLVMFLTGLGVMFVIARRRMLVLVGQMEAEFQTDKEMSKLNLMKVRAVFDQSFQFIGLLDTVGTLIEANQTSLRFAGVSADQVIGKPFWETPWWAHSNRLKLQLQDSIRAAAAGEFVRFETTHLDLNGEEHTIDFSLKPFHDEQGQVIWLIPEGRDITEIRHEEKAIRLAQEAAEMALRDNNSLKRTLDERAIVSEADSKGRIVSVNDEFCRISGYTRDELLGQNHRIINSGTHSKEFWQQMWKTISSGKAWRGEVCNRTKAGKTYWVDSIIAPVMGIDGKTKKYVSIRFDITERKTSEAALEESNWHLIVARTNAEKLMTELQKRNQDLEVERQRAEAANQSKSEFLANMSHEIRTPMTAIMGYADLLVEEANTDQLQERRLQNALVIKRNGEHLLRIIDDILDLSKIEAGKQTIELVASSPVAIIEDVLSVMRVRAQAKGIDLTVVYETLMPATFQSDPTRLRQILVNLVGNAIKFTEVGSVKLIVRLVAANEPSLEFDVVDEGIGLSSEQLTRLFRPFVQADTTMSRKFGGTGLGLTISKRLAEMLGGDVSVVESALGKGSSFRLVVATGPLDGIAMIDLSGKDVEKDARTHVVKSQVPSCSLAGCRVLLAEDGPDNQQLISFVIRKAGADVTVVENGQLAVDATLQAVEAGRPFDVILMDMQMPVLDGYGAVGVLRAKGYRRPIIALTAHSMTGDREKCVTAGCDDYASKPINRVLLISTCRKWMDTVHDKSAHSDDPAAMAKLGTKPQPAGTVVFASEFAKDSSVP
jgi:PAS domain S-box-containing protein